MVVVNFMQGRLQQETPRRKTILIRRAEFTHPQVASHDPFTSTVPRKQPTHDPSPTIWYEVDASTSVKQNGSGTGRYLIQFYHTHFYTSDCSCYPLARTYFGRHFTPTSVNHCLHSINAFLFDVNYHIRSKIAFRIVSQEWPIGDGERS